MADRFTGRESGGSSDLSITLDEGALDAWLERTAAPIETPSLTPLSPRRVERLWGPPAYVVR